jgi:DUF438 domain-containing protein
LEGSLLHIRYFALRDAKAFFHGTLEVSKVVAENRRLEGQRRLLNWENWDGRLLFQE